MSTKTYRMPERFGGEEVRIIGTEGSNIAGVLVETVQPPHVRVALSPDRLIEVVPPLPEAPPVGSFVYAGSSVLQRRDDAGIDWWEYQDRCWLTWAQVCELGTPVRLIPAPVVEPVALPWAAVDTVTPSRAMVETSHTWTGRVYVDAPNQNLTTADARMMARALNTASDAADAAKRAS